MRVLLIVILFTLMGCTAYRDGAAVKRVTANRELLDKVFYEGLRLHPCLNDTVVMSKLHTDTIVSTAITSENDTIYVRLRQTIYKRDTVVKTVVDRLKIGILTDSLNSSRVTIANRDGQIVTLYGDIRDLKRTKMYLMGAIALLTFGIGLGIYFKK